MKQTRSSTAVRAGDVSSEHAVPDVHGRRWRIPTTNTNDADNGRTASPAIAEQTASSPESRATPLRRWSVAELIAQAAANSPADDTSCS
jgi:hypothetical protein